MPRLPAELLGAHTVLRSRNVQVPGMRYVTNQPGFQKLVDALERRIHP